VEDIMNREMSISRDERTLAGLAHGSIVLGLFTNGVGGVLAALVIWLTQKEKSPYIAAQSLQALVYQTIVFVVTMAIWCCWGALWMAMIFLPLLADPISEQAVLAGTWGGMLLMIVPLSIWAMTVLYGLFGAARCIGGHNFKYVVIGSWLEKR
jgi:uncharacterized Tic20 family protein